MPRSPRRVAKPGMAMRTVETVVVTRHGVSTTKVLKRVDNPISAVRLTTFDPCVTGLQGAERATVTQQAYVPAYAGTALTILMTGASAREQAYGVLIRAAKGIAQRRALGETIGTLRFTPQSRLKDCPDLSRKPFREWLGDPAQEGARGKGVWRYHASLFSSGRIAPATWDSVVRALQEVPGVEIILSDRPAPGSQSGTHLRETHVYRKPRAAKKSTAVRVRLDQSCGSKLAP